MEAQQSSNGERICISIYLYIFPRDREREGGAKNPPEIPKYPNILRLYKIIGKVRVNFCLFHCDTSEEPNRNCSEKLQTNVFIWVDFFGWSFLVWIYREKVVWTGVSKGRFPHCYLCPELVQQRRLCMQTKERIDQK